MATKITHVFTDCDGCLTDNRVLYMEDGSRARFFSVYDGYGFKMLQDAGIRVAILSGENDKSIVHRAAKLGVPFYHTPDKLKWVKDYLDLSNRVEDRAISMEEIAFMGNDLSDLPLLKEVGYPFCPADAHPRIWAYCFYEAGGANSVVDEYGDHGAFRAMAERVLELNPVI